MFRIVGVNIPNEKRIIIGLTYIYGIGIKKSKKILNDLKINENKKVKDLLENEINLIYNKISKLSVEGNLRRNKNFNIKRLIEIKCYRGIRHIKNLPLRGQRTRTNARTRKGPKKLVINKKIIKKKI